MTSLWQKGKWETNGFVNAKLAVLLSCAAGTLIAYRH